MIYKNKFFIYRILVILICFITVDVLMENLQCKAEESKVLILYDGSKEYGAEENLLNDLVKTQLSNGKAITIDKINFDNLKELDGYDEIWVLNIKGFNDDIKDLKDKLSSYNKSVHWLEKNSDIFNNLNKDKLKSKNETYFYLDNVTPFNDLNDLIDEIDCLKNSGIKFFIEASPVFVNEDSKAMGRFAECLRYAQANGGKIILKFPIINSKGVDGNSTSGKIINEKVKEAFKNYTNYWVYPVGMSIDDSLLYREDLKSLFECTDTLFLNSADNINIDISNYTIKSYSNIIQKINLDDYIDNNKTKINGQSAVCVESDCKLDEFKKNIDKILNKEIILIPNSKLNSYMKFDSEVKGSSKGIFFNNQDVTQQRFINEEEYESAFNKKDSKETPIKEDLTQANRKLEILSAVALVIFIIILIISKNIERKRFFK